MRIIFVRHGHPDYSTDSLTETGHVQAAAAAKRLANEGIGAIFASSMGRAQQTAQYTADLLNLPITTLHFMRELDWGGPAYNPWIAADKLAKDGVNLLTSDVSQAPGFAGGTVFDSQAERTAAFDQWLAELGYQREGIYYRCTRASEDVIAVFSHGGSSSAAIAHMLGLPLPYFMHIFPINFTSVTAVNLYGAVGERVTPTLEVLNDYRHIL